jgi:DMSO/TMAO reductase YedYZ molybdopterin-dependent catalytic subunit
MGALIGAVIPYHSNLPSGLIPVAFADSLKDFTIVGKDGLIVLNDRPINAETPAHLPNDDVTPNARHFVRNSGIPPKLNAMDPDSWVLTIDGKVRRQLSLTVDDLKTAFETVELNLQLECGGNGRAGFNPPVRGNQ